MGVILFSCSGQRERKWRVSASTGGNLVIARTGGKQHSITQRGWMWVSGDSGGRGTVGSGELEVFSNLSDSVMSLWSPEEKI